MVQDSCLLFNSIHLENFVLHQDTFVDFKRPIMLLTGSNGSGKTLFLEGLLLAAGIKSQRIRDGKINSILGEFGNNTRISLTINNPIIDDYRQIRFGTEEFDKIIDFNKFKIVLEYGKSDANLKYYIQNRNKKYPIAKNFLTQIFDLVNLDTRNKLAFTESTDVQELVSNSPRKRFESFLKITGLYDRFDKVQELAKSVNNFKSIFRQLDSEKTRRLLELNELRQELEQIKMKDRLIARKNEILSLQAWYEYQQIKNNIEVSNEAMYELEKDLTAIQQRVKESQAEYERLEGDINRTETKKDSEESSRDDLIKKQAYFEFQIKNSRDKLRKLKEHIEQCFISKSYERNNSAGEINKNEQIVETINEQIKDLQSRYNKLIFELDSIDKAPELCKKIAPSNEKTDDVSELNHACFSLSVKLYEKGIKFIGPIGKNIELQNIAHAQIVGKYLTAFIIYCVDDCKEVFEIINSEYKQYSQSIVIALFSKNTDEIDPLHYNCLQPISEIINTEVSDIKDFIDNKMNLFISTKKNKTKSDIVGLIDVAIKEKIQIYIEDYSVLINPNGTFEFSDSKYIKIYEQLKNHNMLSIDEIAKIVHSQKQVQVLRNEINSVLDDIKNKENECADCNEKLQQNIENNKKSQEIDSEILKTNQEIEQLNIDIEDYEIEKQNVAIKISQISILDTLKIEISDLRKQKEHESRNIGKFQNEELRITNEIKRIKVMKEIDNKKMIEKLNLANSLGLEKPTSLDTISINDLLQEMNQIDYQLSRLKHLNVTMEQFQKKENEYNAHCKKYERSKTIFNETFIRLEEEKSSWNQEIEDNVKLINKYLQRMLIQRFTSVKISLTDQIDIKSSGLQIDGQHRQSGTSNSANIRALSGGERGLVTEAFIFATHLLINSPVHVIDEFTQRMDFETKALAFNIASFTALKAFEIAEKNANKKNGLYKPQFILSCPDTAGLEFIDNSLFEHFVCLRLSNGSVKIN